MDLEIVFLSKSTASAHFASSLNLGNFQSSLIYLSVGSFISLLVGLSPEILRLLLKCFYLRENSKRVLISCLLSPYILRGRLEDACRDAQIIVLFFFSIAYGNLQGGGILEIMAVKLNLMGPFFKI